MNNTIGRSLFLICGLLALGPASAGAQPPRSQDPRNDSGYDSRYPPPRVLVALQDDLRILDDDLSVISSRHPRYQEFQRRADNIRQDVTVLAEEMDQSRQGRRDDPVRGSGEISDLRQRIAVLRDDLEIAQDQGGRGRNNVWSVPAGTQIEVMLDRDLSSRSSNLEDRVEASTISAVRINGRTVIPSGATVSGVVREVRSRSRGERDGWLRFDFDTLTLDNGVRTSMRSHVLSIAASRTDNNRVRNGGLGALLGGVIGGIIDGRKGFIIGAAVGAGGGLLASEGGDVDLPGGTLITLRLDAPMSLGRR